MAERKPFVWGSSGVELLQSGDTLAGVGSGGGTLSLLSTATVSSPGAAVEFTGLTNEYFKYIIVVDNCRSSITTGSTNVSLQVYVDGVGWKTSLTDYFCIWVDSSASYLYQNNYIAYAYTESGKGYVYFSGKLSIINPCESKLTHFIEASFISYGINAGLVIYSSGSQQERKLLVRNPANSVITGLRIIPVIGTITEGAIKLYGIKA